MIRHIVLVKWRDPLAIEERARLVELNEALNAVRDDAPTVRSLEYGASLGVVDVAANFALTADFDDVMGWRAYLDHPRHHEVRDIIHSLAAEVWTAQFTMSEFTVQAQET
jgi:hypothetical protein